MTYNKQCKNCGSEMKEIRTEKIIDTSYHYLRCENCKKEVARRDD